MMQLELPTRSPLPLSVNDMDEKPSSSSSFSSFPSLTFEDTRSFLRRALPTVDGGGGSSSRRMRVAIEPSLSSLSTRLSGSKSLGRDVGHAAAETYLVTRLAITLLRYLRFPFLRVGCRWITKFVALICYATFLMPGFLQVGYFFFFSSPVRRSIIYGDKPRNLLDLYFPTKTDGLRPVVAFVTGGAWIIGYKAWGALLGKRLAERGIIVACKDYRNFPQRTICSMVEDVSQGISFMCNNAEAYGVDPNRVYLIGQSAGAHMAACTILNQEIKERREGESTSWSVSQIKAYFGISGGVGYRWITKFLALVCYATLLTPGFLQVGYFYFFSSQVRRSIIYGDKPRNRLDLYLPAKTDGLRPVVAFVTGGAWIIGYKAWGALLGRRLAERGIIVACIDYRNFPQGTISSMVEDVSQGISFMCNNAEAYGGDPNRIYLIGQSAGAHIASCTILNQAITECGEGESTAWSVSQIKAYFGISGGYNVVELVDHFHRRGLYQSIFLSVMEGEKSLRKFSPEILVKDSSVKHAISLMPPTILFHGTGDYSIPSTSSEKFANALHNAGAKVKLVLYDGKTHTDLFLQDPLRGGRDKLLQEIISVIYAGDELKFLDDAETPLSRRLVPEFMLKLAGRISPF